MRRKTERQTIVHTIPQLPAEAAQLDHTAHSLALEVSVTAPHREQTAVEGRDR